MPKTFMSNDFYKNFQALAGGKLSRQMDVLTQNKYHISPEVLMESAGGASGLLLYSHPLFAKFRTSTLVILCGPGHNGADSLVLARHWLSYGKSVCIFCTESAKKPPLLKIQKQRLLSQNIPLYDLKNKARLKKALNSNPLVVDGLFGVGCSKNLNPEYARLFKEIKNSKARVLALDTPSGLNADTGQIYGTALKADFTFSFGLNKPGFYLREGPLYTGKIITLPIGFPPDCLKPNSRHTHFLITPSFVSPLIPKRKAFDHKAKHGHLLVLAGGKNLWGCAVLTTEAAYRMGAGYVTWSAHQTPPLKVPDALNQSALSPSLFHQKTAVALGPGLGVSKATSKLLLRLKKTRLPVVVDADAFVTCVREKLFPLPSHWVLTPHSGELGKLFQTTGGEIDKDRCGFAIKASLKTGSLILLKGFYSVLAMGGQCWIIPKGNAALAKAGTGDVLTGFIGALLARGLNPFEATSVGAFLHGSLAEEWTRTKNSQESLMAQDLKDLLPPLLQKMTKANTF